MLPKQSDFLRDRQTLMLGYGGGIGAGKTVAALIKAVMRCQRCPNALGLVARKDFPKLLDSILTKLWKLFPKLEDRYNGEEQIIYFDNGAKLYIRHGTDPQDFKGPDFSFAYLDQIEELTEFIFFHILGRLRHEDGEPIQLIFTFNPSGHDWVWRIFKKNQNHLDAKDGEGDPQMRIIETKTFDNIYLPDRTLRLLEIMKKNQPTLYRRLVEGSWDATAGLVYENFGPEHIYDPDDLSIPFDGMKLRGTDFGQTNQNFTTLWYVDENFNHFCYKEHIICGENATLGVIAEGILEACTVPDPITGRPVQEDYTYSFLDPWSGFKSTQDKNGLRCSIAEIWSEDYGLDYAPATRNKKAAVAHVRNLMAIDPKHINPFTGRAGAPYLYISKACPELIEQTRNLKRVMLPVSLEGYRNQPEEIQKIDDHGPDSMWMALASRPFVQTQNGVVVIADTYAGRIVARTRTLEPGETLDKDEFDEIFYGSTEPAYAYPK